MVPSRTFAQVHLERVVRGNPSHSVRRVRAPLRRGESLVPHGFLASLKMQGTVSNRALQRLAQEAAWQAVRRQEGAATAEAPSKTTPPAPAGSAIETARRLFLEAMEAYRTGAYSAAVEGFQRVREMPGLPDEVYACSLWNISQCFLRLGNREAAAEYVRAYLASPGISDADRTEAESVLAEITGGKEGESVAGSVEQAPTGTAEGATPTPAEEGPLPTEPVARGRQLHEQAVRFYGAGNYGEALARFGQIMEISGLPANVYTMTLWNMARCYQGLGNIPMALAMLRGYLAQEGLSSADRAEASDLLRQLAGAGTEEAGERLPETVPSPPAGAQAPAAPKGALPTDPVARGRALYAQATEAYGAGRYPEALALFRQIVDITGLPDEVHRTMLWNMAMCHRRMGNNTAAIAMLRTFLAQPGINDADRADAQALIAELQGSP